MLTASLNEGGAWMTGRWLQHGRDAMPGMAAVALIVGTAWLASRQLGLERYGIGALSLALLLGMAAGNIFPLAPRLQSGIRFAQQRLLRLGVMLFGLHISLGMLLQVGWQALGIDLLVMAMILIPGIWLGIRIFRLDPALAVMTAAGSAICGAAAVLATESVVRGNSSQTSMAVATVVLFGTLAILIYPMIYHYSAITPEHFGIYIGATVHEVAQVVAVGHSIGDTAEQTAVIVKLMRVMLLAPTLLLLALWWRRGNPRCEATRIAVPWFAFGFVGVVIVNSVWAMPQPLHAALNRIDILLLSAAMAALGLGTRLAQLRALGLRPLLFAGLLFIMLVFAGDLISGWLLPQ